MELYSPLVRQAAGLLRVDSPPETASMSASHLSPVLISRIDSYPAKPFLPRSKSDITMSSLPNLAEVPTSPSEESLTSSSHTTRSASVAQIREEKSGSLAKSLLSRSSRLLHKRKSSNKISDMGDTYEGRTDNLGTAPVHVSTNKRRSRHARVESKPTISEPFNFQHLTHTGPAQAKTLKSAGHHDLVSEYSAIRASQAPQPALKGIKAEDITSPSSSFQRSISSRPASPVASPPATSEPRSLRSSKSVDSFTRVSTKSFCSPKPPISPPPRRSSRHTTKVSSSMAFSPLPMESPTIPNMASPTSNSSSPVSYFNMKPPFASPNADEIAQAVTTPDNSAYLLINHSRGGSGAGVSAGLADVPEEEEDGSKQDGSSAAPPHSLRHARSFPSVRSFVPSIPERLPWSTPQADAYSSRSSRSNSIEAPVGHTSWEDDIDYCYEHAMEAADDGLGWEQSSAEEENIWMQEDTTKSSTPTPALNNVLAPDASPESNAYPESFLSEMEEASSATSSAISIPGLVTPSDPSAGFCAPNERNASRPLYPLSPSLLVPKEYSSRVTHEENYTQNLSGTDGNKQAQQSFPYYSHDHDLRARGACREDLNSPRSSGTHISKSTSRDSLATGKSSAAVSKHRRSSSIGSVPELVSGSASLNNSAFNGRPLTISSVANSDHFPIQHTDDNELQLYEAFPISHTVADRPDPLSHLPPPPQNALPSLPAPAPAPTASLPPAPIPQPPFAARSRANSETVKGLQDLMMIGAPSRTPARLRSGSLAPAAGPPALSPGAKPKGHRTSTSYSLFPQGSMSSMRDGGSPRF